MNRVTDVIQPYQLLDHTADLEIRVFGRTVSELFTNAAIALSELLFGKTTPSTTPTQREAITVMGENQEDLLVNWLSELLFRCNRERTAVINVSIQRCIDTECDATVGFSPATQIDDIKAVTYHDLSMKKVGDHWEATVVFDV